MREILENAYKIIDEVAKRPELGLVVSEERERKFDENAPEIFDTINRWMGYQGVYVGLAQGGTLIQNTPCIGLTYTVEWFDSDSVILNYLMQKGVMFEVLPANSEQFKLIFMIPGIWEDKEAA